MRIAGTRGVLETALVEEKVTLLAADRPPGTLPLIPQADIFTQFARSLRGEGPPPLTLHEACRVTEIALKAQQAADTGAPSPCSTRPTARPEPRAARRRRDRRRPPPVSSRFQSAVELIHLAVCDLGGLDQAAGDLLA